MFTTHVCGWLAATLAGLLFQPGSPGQSTQPSPDTPAGPPAFVEEMRYLDTDRDRQLDPKEFAHGQQMAAMLLMLSWDECDRDSDGFVSHSEFELAASEAMKGLLQAGTAVEEETAAEEELAAAIPVQVLLSQLAAKEQFAGELADLRAAMQNLDDDEAVVTHIVENPTRYPRLAPVIRTWVRHYPVRPALRQHVKPLHPLSPKYRHHPHPGPRSPKGPGKPGPKPKGPPKP